MNKQFTQLMIRVGRVQYLILMLVASGFVIFGRYFITNIYSTIEYAQAYPVALLLILPAMIPLIQNLGIEIQRAVNKHQVRAIIYFIMALLNVVISIPLAKTFGPVGSAMGTAIGLVLANGIIINIYYQFGMGLDMIAFWKSVLSLSKGMIAPVVVGGFIMRCVTFEKISEYLFFIVVYTMVYIVSMWNFGMNVEEKALVAKLLQRGKK